MIRCFDVSVTEQSKAEKHLSIVNVILELPELPKLPLQRDLACFLNLDSLLAVHITSQAPLTHSVI